MTRIFLSKAFTMMEIMITLVIIGVLATIGFSQYQTSMESALAREARVGLEVIFAAERIIFLQTGGFVACNNTTDCNTNLNLDLRAGGWDYSVAVVAGPNFTATATRTGGLLAYNTRTITLTNAEVWDGTWEVARWW
ncbi:MAG: prepilin-type N-terminal cleavage/methylation domain-containing protein [Candidatus Omnitrophota bacterium]